MAIPKLQKIVRATYALDGGSICFYVLDDNGSIRNLELVQDMLRGNSTVKRRFGRLYLDDCLIDVRSSDETALINFLQTTSDRSGYDMEVEKVINFVRSEEYVQLAHATSGKSGANNG